MPHSLPQDFCPTRRGALFHRRRNFVTKGLWAVLTVAAMTAACAKIETPAASDAWIRLAAVPGRPAAGYFTIHGGKADTRLVGVTVAGVPRVELHLSRMTAGDMMTMDATPSVDLPARATLPFAPVFTVALALVAQAVLRHADLRKEPVY